MIQDNCNETVFRMNTLIHIHASHSERQLQRKSFLCEHPHLYPCNPLQEECECVDQALGIVV